MKLGEGTMRVNLQPPAFSIKVVYVERFKKDPANFFGFYVKCSGQHIQHIWSLRFTGVDDAVCKRTGVSYC